MTAQRTNSDPAIRWTNNMYIFPTPVMGLCPDWHLAAGRECFPSISKGKDLPLDFRNLVVTDKSFGRNTRTHTHCTGAGRAVAVAGSAAQLFRFSKSYGPANISRCGLICPRNDPLLIVPIRSWVFAVTRGLVTRQTTQDRTSSPHVHYRESPHTARI